MADTNAIGERFAISRVVARAMEATKRNFALFVMLALVLSGAPQAGLVYVRSYSWTDWYNGPAWLLTAGATVILVGASLVLVGALTHASLTDMAGKKVTLSESLAGGFRHGFSLLALNIFTSVGVLIGLALLIVPGAILAVRWAAAAGPIVAEGMAPMQAMGRSAELSRTHRWAIFALILLYVGFLFAISAAEDAIVQALFNAEPLIVAGVSVATIGTVATTMIAATLSSVVGVVGAAGLYCELKRVKEGPEVETIAEVFA